MSRNIIRSTTEFALHILAAYMPDRDANPDDPSAFTCIDATCGGGRDSLALAGLLWPDGNAAGSSRRLLAFDIQQEAVSASRDRLQASGFARQLEDGRISLICDSHEHMEEYADRADLVVFNLGYLPGGDKALTTLAPSTLAALDSALRMLRPDGIICMTMYSGHPAGAKEKNELLALTSKLDPKKFHVAYISMLNQRRDPPEILLITKKL